MNLTDVAFTATKLSHYTQHHDAAVRARAHLHPPDATQAAILDDRVDELATALSDAQTAYDTAIGA